ncbi:hypothetical protein [Immundisolibacter sp.]
MSLFDELFADILTAQGESRPRSPAGRPAERETPCGLSPESPRSPAPPDGKVAPAGAGHGLAINYGKGYRHPDGRIETGQPGPMPRPALEWPADLAALLARVSVAFEWTAADLRDFRQWAQRSPDGLADARAFLEAEAARLPVPGLDARRRFVLERLAADPALRVAWTCADDGADPLRLVVAIRGGGACELAIARERFDALALPGLIGQLAGAP